MAAMTKEQFITELDEYLLKIEGLVLSGGPDGGKLYTEESTIPAGGTKLVAITTAFSLVVADYHLYTTGIQLQIVDPEDAAAVISGESVLDYKIAATGLITITNRHTAPVKYYLRLTRPIAK